MSKNNQAVKQNTPKKMEKQTPKNKKSQVPKSARSSSSRSDALSPVALGSGQSLLPPSRVSEEFRWGEFSDDGSTVLDGPNTTNQILFSVPVNPRRILSFAKTNTIGSTDPMVYKSESEILNAYQYEIDSCSIKATCVVPNTVSFTLAMFITPNLESVIDSTSVMNIYASLPSSAKREISIKGDINLTFRSGRAYIKDDPLDSQFDPRLCFGGYIVGFIKAPCVAGLSADDSRAYNGPICTVALSSSITYYGFQYNGSALDQPQLYTAVESEVSIANNGFFPKDLIYQYIKLDGDIGDYTVSTNCTMVSVNIPDELENAVLASSGEQQQSGEILGSTGDYRSVVTPLSRGSRPTWVLSTNDTLGVPFEEMSRVSIVDGLKSAFAYIKDIPNQIKSGLVSVLGKDAGNTVFKVGSNLALLGLKTLTGLRSDNLIPPPPFPTWWNSSSAVLDATGWTPEGYPFLLVTRTGAASSNSGTYRAPIAWWLYPGSPVYNEAIDGLPPSQRSVAQSLLEDSNGPQPMIWMQPSSSYLTDQPDSFTGGPAFVGRPGIVSFWELLKPSGSVVKNTFGQPLQVAGGHNIIEPRVRSSCTLPYLSRHSYKQLRRKRYGAIILTKTSSDPYLYFSNGDIDFSLTDLPQSLLYRGIDGPLPIAKFMSIRLSDLNQLELPGVYGDLDCESHPSSTHATFTPRSAVSSTGIKPQFSLPPGDYLIEFSYFSEHDEFTAMTLIQRRLTTHDEEIPEEDPNHLKRDFTKLSAPISKPSPVGVLGRIGFH